MTKGIAKLLLCALALLLAACDSKPINNPHTKPSTHQKIYHASFAEQPRTLDPARSYSSNESLFTAQIYEPPLQYHYLKRPYELIPLTATRLPAPQYFDSNNQRLPDNASAKRIAYTLYTIEIKPGTYYQPHPAFAKNNRGDFLYHQLSKTQSLNLYHLNDFEKSGTRELTAADYVYQIKRLAHPALQSPIYGLMSHYIVGLQGYGELLQKEYQQHQIDEAALTFFDLRKYPLEGVKILSKYQYQIKVKGKYPQMLYWLAMPFFAPVPWEADAFYSQALLSNRNINFDWYPIGTGPYMLTENNPNSRMVLTRNPNFREETYPHNGDPSDHQAGFLELAGHTLPLIDQYIFSLEKESIPRWNKFLQGYYDNSGISSDSFDQAIQVDAQGKPDLTPLMKQRNIQLTTSVGPSIFYHGFNMLDEIVGGLSPRARHLRQAISIALDYEEFISIFLNGRGLIAQGPLPPGIFGHLPGVEGINTYVYQWLNGKVKRKPIDEAKKLLAEAGYPNGRNAKTGEPLILNYDVPASSGPDDKARFDWMRKQFAKLGIELHIRATQYNRFQEKMRNGNAQIFSWGWLADYPDPENFLFLLYGPNGKVKHGGENAANYQNPKYDKLFEKMKNMPNGPQRQKIINQMLKIARQDSPWIWGFHPKNFALSHAWMNPTKPNEIANNTLKYRNIDPQKREQKQQEWNKPIFRPLFLLIGILILAIAPMAIKYWRREHHSAVK